MMYSSVASVGLLYAKIRIASVIFVKLIIKVYQMYHLLVEIVFMSLSDIDNVNK